MEYRTEKKLNKQIKAKSQKIWQDLPFISQYTAPFRNGHFIKPQILLILNLRMSKCFHESLVNKFQITNRNSKSFKVFPQGERKKCIHTLSTQDQGTLDIKYSPHTDQDQNIQTDVDNTDTPCTKAVFYYGKTERIIAGMDLAL